MLNRSKNSSWQFVSTFILFLFLTCNVVADTTTETLSAKYGTVVVDGKVDEFWQDVPSAKIDKRVALENSPSGDLLTKATVKCAWAKETLYFLVDVVDPVIRASNRDPWQQDSVEIFVDTDQSRSVAIDNNDFQYRISAIGEVSTGLSADAGNIIAKVVPMTGGYRVECSIRCSSVSESTRAIGFEIQINNDPGTGNRESISKWNHSTNDSWNSTVNYGTLSLSVPNLRSHESAAVDDAVPVQSQADKSVDMSKTPNVPDWAADAVFYQIFPERFCNGDTSNDPTRGSLEFPEIVPANWQITPWTDQWYKRADWEQAIGDNFYEDGVFHRRFGGDLQGVLSKLDYLHNLGINVIYFNPVFYARSLHKYDGNSFHHVDPHFGPDPKGDFSLMATETADPSTWKWTAADKLFLKLIAEAHRRKIRVIIDGVFNHTGRDFFAFKDVAQKQSESLYKDWYIVKDFDDPNTEQNEFKYKGWWGVDTLPEFANNDAGNDLHPAPKQYILQATTRWMDPNGDGNPNDGIDGWRLDVANEVPNKFWQDWNQHVRRLNPRAYTVAEIWDDASQYLSDCEFSATMNYHGFAFPCKGFLIDGTMKASEFAEMIEKRLQDHHPRIQYALQNLFDSHDTDRIASMIVNARRKQPYQNSGRFDYDIGERVSPRYARNYDVTQPNEFDKKVLRIATLFQMTFVGAPMVYYGTEAGMDGADDPDDRMPMVWEDMKYDPRTLGPYGELIQSYEIKFDKSLFEYYQALIALRNDNKSLRRGSFEVIHTDDKQQTLVFSRILNGELLLVAINRGDNLATIDLPNSSKFKNNVKLKLLFDSGSFKSKPDPKMPDEPTKDSSLLKVEALSGQVWRVID